MHVTSPQPNGRSSAVPSAPALKAIASVAASQRHVWRFTTLLMSGFSMNFSQTFRACASHVIPSPTANARRRTNRNSRQLERRADILRPATPTSLRSMARIGICTTTPNLNEWTTSSTHGSNERKKTTMMTINGPKRYAPLRSSLSLGSFAPRRHLQKKLRSM